MRYEKPELVCLAEAVTGIQNPSHTKGIPVASDSNLNDPTPTSGAYDADE